MQDPRWSEWISANDTKRLAPLGTYSDAKPDFYLTQVPSTKMWTRDDLDLFLDLPCCQSRSLKYLCCGMECPTTDQLSKLTLIDTLELFIDNADDALAGTLSTLSNVRSLGLRHGAITDKGLQDIAKMTRLDNVFLFDLEHVTDAGAQHLRQYQGRLTLFHVNCRGIAPPADGKEE